MLQLLSSSSTCWLLSKTKHPQIRCRALEVWWHSHGAKAHPAGDRIAPCYTGLMPREDAPRWERNSLCGFIWEGWGEAKLGELGLELLGVRHRLPTAASCCGKRPHQRLCATAEGRTSSPGPCRSLRSCLRSALHLPK